MGDKKCSKCRRDVDECDNCEQPLDKDDKVFCFDNGERHFCSDDCLLEYVKSNYEVKEGVIEEEEEED